MESWTMSNTCFGDCIPLLESAQFGFGLQFSYPSLFVWHIIFCGFEMIYLFTFLTIKCVTRINSWYENLHPTAPRDSTLAQCAKYLTSFIGLANLGISTWSVVSHWVNTWSPSSPYAWIIYLAQAFIWLMISFTLSFRKIQPLFKTLRTLWIVTFILISFTAISAGLEILQQRNISVEVVLDLATWLVGCLLFLLAFASVHVSDNLSEPLVVNNNIQDGQAEKNRTLAEKNRTPFADASAFSRIAFLWLGPLLSLGNTRPLAQKDLPRLACYDESEVAFNEFERVWEQQKAHSPKGHPPSVFWTLAAGNWKDLACNGIFALLKSATLSCGPLLLNSFVNYAQGKVLFRYEGFVLVAVLFFAKVLESCSQRQWYFGSRRIGMHLHSALIGAIYKKSLHLSSVGRQSHSAGEIVNYMAVDAYRIGEFPYWMHMIWTTPMQIGFALAILFSSVGWATLAGLCVIILTMLVNSPLARLQHKYQSLLMKAQDERLRETSEVLRNMKILKLQTWEAKFKNLIYQLREVECRWLSAVQFRKTFNSLVFWLSPVLVSTATFIACYCFEIPLTANNVFTALATLRIIQEPIRIVPDVVAVIIQVRVSLSRIQNFLLDDELDNDAVERDDLKHHQDAIEIRDATLSWDPSSIKATLQHISFHVKLGERVAVCGEVGSGKSSLLSAILGEITKLSGVIRVSGSTAYVSQIAWIQSGTIRDNILFGLPMDKDRYKRTLCACELHKDLKLFTFGDLTEIGERGLNLSGGQKQRIQLARAIYQDADIYLLDDPFSAVDAQTSSSLFQNTIMGALANKAVILVTHQVEFLPAFDFIMLMQDGEICEAGRYDDLLNSESAFEELVIAHKEVMGTLHEGSEVASLGTLQKESKKTPMLLKKLSSIKSQKQPHPDEVKKASGQLTQEEEKEMGNTGTKPYLDYLKQKNGFLYAALGTLSQIIFVGGQMASNWWMAAGVENPNITTARLISVYSSIGITTGCILYFRTFFAVVMGLEASRAFFSGVMEALFQAPMTFFDSTPTGRLISRLSTDFSILDIDVPLNFMFSISATLNALSSLTVTAMVTWQILVVVIPMLYLNRRLQLYYLASSRELMRINGTTKAPIANHFSETISGAATIRAYKKEDQFMRKILQLRDANSSSYFHSIAANEWLIQRLEALAMTVLCSSALLIVLLPSGYIDAGFVGLAISYGLSLNVSLVFSVQNQCTLANYIISVERISQYLHLPAEAPLIIEHNRPSSNWPTSGRIELKKLQIRYRPDSPLVLRGITCTFEAGHRVGVVGRTGSGKSTLISALFRLVEPAGGTILIDNLDVSLIGLHDLRSKLSIIPQEPTLFRGTVRFNLDPLELYPDSEIWKALEKCQLGDVIREKSEQLDSAVGDDGENWSVGQRQLFCLGRALLKSSRILVLDEATASIDNATDAILQKLIREEFSGCTVITVAHRIPTVVDSDEVLALSDGMLVEFDQPMKLLEDEKSLFAKLVAEYWSNAHAAVDVNHGLDF